MGKNLSRETVFLSFWKNISRENVFLSFWKRSLAEIEIWVRWRRAEWFSPAFWEKPSGRGSIDRTTPSFHPFCFCSQIPSYGLWEYWEAQPFCSCIQDTLIGVVDWRQKNHLVAKRIKSWIIFSSQLIEMSALGVLCISLSAKTRFVSTEIKLLEYS